MRLNISGLSVSFLLLFPSILSAQALVRTGDTIELHLTGIPSEENDVNGAYTVDDNGMINLPNIDHVKIAGLLPAQIQRLIQNLYIEKKIYVHPKITVEPVDKHKVVILVKAGESNSEKVELIRDGKKTIYNLEYIRKAKSEDPKVLPGDRIIVSTSMRFNGDSTRIPYTTGMTLTAAVMAGGGFDTYAD